MKRLHGHKTNIGCVVILTAAILYHFRPSEGMSLFMVGTAIAFYGVYYRSRRIKKHMLRSGI